MRKLLSAIVLTLLLAVSAAADGPYLFSVTQYGPDVTARFTAPDGAALVFAVYDRATGQMTDCQVVTVPAKTGTRYETVTFDRTPSSPETVKGFLLDTSTNAPLCRAVLSDVIPASADSVTKDGSYTSKEEVALYLHVYGHLPGNFLTKAEAEALGWSGGSLEPYAPGKCIGGSRFGNYEGLLPAGQTYCECDIDTLGKSSRGTKRIVWSDDGLIYYTDDHYQSFTLLYGAE